MENTTAPTPLPSHPPPSYNQSEVGEHHEDSLTFNVNFYPLAFCLLLQPSVSISWQMHVQGQ